MSSRATKTLALVWGLGGVVAILASALVRLSPKVLTAFDMSLGVGHFVFAAVWVAFMLYSEGYRGFQLRFSPTCAARAWHLAEHPRPLHLLLAPLFCMGFFHASRRRLMTSWILTSMIVGVVLVVHRMPQPWRGLIDLGVVAGLSYGAVSLLVIARQGPGRADPQLP
jgi:hypothetical protein